MPKKRNTPKKSITIAKKISKLMIDKKALDIDIIDVRKITALTDFFVICSGDSEPQVKAIADNIRRGTPHKPRHLEGYENLNWVLLDYFDVVVHVFKKDDRDYYNIEKLWGDAPITEFIDEETETTDH